MPQIVLDTDAFTNADTTSLPAHSANWVQLDTGAANNCTIIGNGVTGILAGNFRTGFTWTNDQWSELVVDATNVADEFFMVGVRLQTDDTIRGYAAGFHPDSHANTIYRIWRLADNILTPTQLTVEPGSTTAAVNDIVNLQVAGTLLTLKVTRGGSDAFTPLTYETDGDATKWSSGNPGVMLYQAAGLRCGDAWRAGSVSGVETTIGGVTSPFFRIKRPRWG